MICNWMDPLISNKGLPLVHALLAFQGATSRVAALQVLCFIVKDLHSPYIPQCCLECSQASKRCCCNGMQQATTGVPWRPAVCDRHQDL